MEPIQYKFTNIITKLEICTVIWEVLSVII